MKAFIALFISVGFLTTMGGCQSDSVQLRNAQTGEVAQCGPYGQMSSQTASATREQCIDEYQRQGYERVK
jgi:hypothetical protein